MMGSVFLCDDLLAEVKEELSGSKETIRNFVWLAVQAELCRRDYDRRQFEAYINSDEVKARTAASNAAREEAERFHSNRMTPDEAAAADWVMRRVTLKGVSVE